MKSGLQLMKNVLAQVAKNVFTSLGLKSDMTKLIISNEEM